MTTEECEKWYERIQTETEDELEEMGSDIYFFGFDNYEEAERHTFNGISKKYGVYPEVKWES